ncbi:MAG TPA: glycosyltransferase [Ignavibacteriales bacterium]|nr:glycosyltransferase [Ignavibacteriales bacterium]
MRANNRVLILFLGNYYYDSRLLSLHKSLKESGYSVRIISFELDDPDFINKDDGEVKIYKLLKRSSPLYFYPAFYFLAFINLFRAKYDFVFAEEVYSLPIAGLIAKIKRAKLFYNSRELYGYIGALRNSKFKQRFWAYIERFFIKFADVVLTTGDMDSEFIRKEYNLKQDVAAIRNIPQYKTVSSPVDLHKKLGIPESGIIILYQGIIVEGRGIDYIIEAIKNLPRIYFVVVGDGPQRSRYEQAALDKNVGERVKFAGRVSHSELLNYTAGADIGASLIENISISYYYALPNKLFEYIMAGLPVISSDLPQMKKIVEEYDTGYVLQMKSPDELKVVLEKLINSPEELTALKKNSLEAAKILNWENEYKKLSNLLELHAGRG